MIRRRGRNVMMMKKHFTFMQCSQDVCFLVFNNLTKQSRVVIPVGIRDVLSGKYSKYVETPLTEKSVYFLEIQWRLFCHIIFLSLHYSST